MLSIGFIVFPGFQVMAFAAVSVFEFANYVAGRTLYDVHLMSEHGGSVRSSLGFAIETEALPEAGFDTIIVGGGAELAPPSPGLAAYLRASVGVTRRVASICTGAFVLAEAGVLDGRRATTHWAHAGPMRARFPKIRVDEDRIFIADGPVWTSAGMTAGIDLGLAMVEADHGAELARSVARKLVVYHRRAGGQSQFSALLELEPKSDRIQNALAYARQNLRAPLTVEDLAKAARLSPRQFSRAFRAETGQSPAKAVEHLRIEAARLMMEQTRHPIDMIADETGFADGERMRRAFIRVLGQPPQTIRRNARVAEAPAAA